MSLGPEVSNFRIDVAEVLPLRCQSINLLVSF